MGKQQVKIYTRSGDDGTTGLSNGVRVDKTSTRIEVIGTIDELNCAIGLLLAQQLPATIAELLPTIQHDLFALGAHLAAPGATPTNTPQSGWLEEQIDRLEQQLPPLVAFILPGGSPATAHAHMARAICRRSERRVLSLNAYEPVGEEIIRYFNRLSDLLFVIARTVNDGREQLWRGIDK